MTFRSHNGAAFKWYPDILQIPIPAEDYKKYKNVWKINYAGNLYTCPPVKKEEILYVWWGRSFRVIRYDHLSKTLFL